MSKMSYYCFKEFSIKNNRNESIHWEVYAKIRVYRTLHKKIISMLHLFMKKQSKSKKK